MSKPNLVGILIREKKRIEELKNVLPVIESYLKDIKVDSSNRSSMQIKYEELKLEYFERTGRKYGL